MIEFNLLGLCVAATWALSLTSESWIAVGIAALVFSSKSIPISLLLLLTLNLISFIQSTLGSRRSGNVVAQKRFFITLLGNFCAIFGASLGSNPSSHPLIFFGLLLSIPTALSSIFFNRFYERMNLSAYLGSVVVPALVSIEILSKIKPEIKIEYGQLWDTVLAVVGLSSYIYASFMAFLRMRLKASIIYLAQAGVGLALFILMIDHENLSKVTLSAISISVISTLVMIGLAAQMGRRYFSFAKIAALGLPGLVGFTSLFFSVKMAISLNLLWVLVLLFGYFLQANTLIGCEDQGYVQAGQKLKIRFWVIVLVQVCSGIGFLWMGGLK